MTIRVGDEVQTLQEWGVWSRYTCTVLYIQDKDDSSAERQWAVVAFKGDIPQVFKLGDVRKVPVVKSLIKQGVMVTDGSIILNVLYPDLHTAVEVHCTEVDGVVDLSYPYTVVKK